MSGSGREKTFENMFPRNARNGRSTRFRAGTIGRPVALCRDRGAKLVFHIGNEITRVYTTSPLGHRKCTSRSYIGRRSGTLSYVLYVTNVLGSPSGRPHRAFEFLVWNALLARSRAKKSDFTKGRSIGLKSTKCSRNIRLQFSWQNHWGRANTFYLAHAYIYIFSFFLKINLLNNKIYYLRIKDRSIVRYKNLQMISHITWIIKFWF